VIVVLSSALSRSDEYKNPNPNTSLETEKVVKLGVGEEGVVKINGSDTVALIADPDSYDDYLNAMTAQDKYGIAELLTANKLFLVLNGTRVKVIDREMGIRKVRVLDGEMEGRAGWTAMEFVVK